jgi:hypothetical protein
MSGLKPISISTIIRSLTIVHREKEQPVGTNRRTLHMDSGSQPSVIEESRQQGQFVCLAWTANRIPGGNHDTGTEERKGGKIRLNERYSCSVPRPQSAFLGLCKFSIHIHVASLTFPCLLFTAEFFGYARRLLS